jgi:hypothetical protein
MTYRCAFLALLLLCLSGCMEGSKPEPLPRAAEAGGSREVTKEVRL